MMAPVPHVTSGSGLRKISGRWIFVGQSVQSLVVLDLCTPVTRPLYVYQSGNKI